MADRILITRSSMPSFEEYTEEIRELWDSHWLTNMGIKHKTLEAELIRYLGIERMSLFTNGHMAIELALEALKLEGEVITTPFTFASTTHAIVRNGLTPVFCDVNPDDFTIDVAKIEQLITPKTCAIMPVHVYGNICNVDEIERIAKKHHLKVFYDAAHVFGVTYNGRGIGDFGDVSCFSFHATKVFNTIEGGAACYHDAELGAKINQLKNFGILNAERVTEIGSNAKMNEFCAAMGICNLRHVDEEIAKRAKVAARYHRNLDGVPGITMPKAQPGVKPNYAYFPVLFDQQIFGADRDQVFAYLAEHDIVARKYFYPVTNDFECYRDRFDPNETPIALDLSHRVLTLPMYADLSEADVDRICEVVLACGKAHA